MASAPEDPSTTNSYPSHFSKPFRFKRPRSRSPSSSPPRKRHSPSTPSSSAPLHPRHTRRHHHHHHRSNRHQPPTPPDNDDAQTHDDGNGSRNGWSQMKSAYQDPESAFRQSLFDALADDEGAAFWEGVYGQPMHTYSPYHPASTSSPHYHHDKDNDNDAPGNDNDHKGANEAQKKNLDKMTEEEYVSYVRKKMWERSHEYIVAERRRREEERKRRKVRDEEGRKWRAGVEEALRRGEERRGRNRWRGVWDGYLAGWEGVKGKGMVVWPVESGKREDVGPGEVEKFFKGVGGVGGVDLGDVLKKERVRWHPDKMQQRAGDGGIDGKTLRVVTAVFQVVDRLWSEVRERA